MQAEVKTASSDETCPFVGVCVFCTAINNACSNLTRCPQVPLTLNAAFCERHRKVCLPSDELARECGKVTPFPSPPPTLCCFRSKAFCPLLFLVGTARLNGTLDL